MEFIHGCYLKRKIEDWNVGFVLFSISTRHSVVSWARPGTDFRRLWKGIAQIVYDPVGEGNRNKASLGFGLGFGHWRRQPVCMSLFEWMPTVISVSVKFGLPIAQLVKHS